MEGGSGETRVLVLLIVALSAYLGTAPPLPG